MKEWRAVLALALFCLFAIGFVAWMGSAPRIPNLETRQMTERPGE